MKKKEKSKRKKIDIPLPDNLESIIRLADWLEIKTLVSDSLSTSKIELESVIKQSGIFDGKPNELVEVLCLSVFSEIEKRIRFIGVCYPFTCEANSLSFKKQRDEYNTYIFCLCLSYFEKLPEKKLYQARRLFEDLACLAAKHFIQGESYRFAHPRNFYSLFLNNSYIGRLPIGFKNAIDEFCKKLGEGEGFNGEKINNAKDKKLDIIAWRDFLDKKSSKLILFGQCATGNTWKDSSKATELIPDKFWRKWIKRSNVSPLMSAYFIPDIVEDDRWNEISIDAGILFERCRISNLASISSINYTDYVNCYKNILGIN